MSSPDDLSEFLALFQVESKENIERLESALMLLEGTPDDPEELKEAFRRAHSIKGGAAMLGMTHTVSIAHVVEEIFSDVRDGESRIDRGALDKMLDAVDALRVLIDTNETSADAVEVERLVAAVGEQRRRCRSLQVARPAISETNRGFTLTPSAMDLRALEVPTSRRAMELMMSGEHGKSPHSAPPIPIITGHELPGSSIPPQTASVAPTTLVDAGPVGTETAPRHAKLPSLGPNDPYRSLAPRNGRDMAAGTMRIPIDRVERLLDYLGEVVIAQSVVGQRARGLEGAGGESLRGAIASLEHHTRQLQERILSIRLTQVGPTLRRQVRVGRDLAAMLGKDVVIEVEGDDVEIDNSLLQGLPDPLTHLVRNALDHGLEKPEQRIAAGKPKQGKVVVRAIQQGGSVVIEVEDDGRGLDDARICRKAIERGLLPPGTELSGPPAWDLVFVPGFSTADAVTDVSGRGVGMDVVRTQLESLGGRVSVDSRPGKGSTFRMHLPLTTAIIDGLVVRVGHARYVVPLEAVQHAMRPSAAQVRNVVGKHERVLWGDTWIRLLRLDELLHGNTDRAVSGGQVLVVATEGGPVGFWFDEVLEQTRVVIKSLENHYRRMPEFVGASVMSDGTIGLILDLRALARREQARITGTFEGAAA
jgi:two-component system, chemotaxis family, sensor kinase CheA